MCYWTGNYTDLEEHISASHAQPESEGNKVPSKSRMTLKSVSEHAQPETEGNEVPSKSRMTLESVSEHHQKSTIRPGLPLGVRSDSALLNKLDHIKIEHASTMWPCNGTGRRHAFYK